MNVMNFPSLPDFPPRLAVRGIAPCGIRLRPEVREMLILLLLLLVPPQLPCALHSRFLLLSVNLLPVHNLHRALHALFLRDSLKVTVLIHGERSETESTDRPATCCPNRCCNIVRRIPHKQGHITYLPRCLSRLPLRHRSQYRT